MSRAAEDVSFDHPNGLLLYQQLAEEDYGRCFFCESKVDKVLAEEIEILGHLEIYREFLEWMRAPEDYRNYYFLTRMREEEVYYHVPHGTQEDWDDDYRQIIYEHIALIDVEKREFVLTTRAAADIYSSIWNTLPRERLEKFKTFLEKLYAAIAPKYVIVNHQRFSILNSA